MPHQERPEHPSLTLVSGHEVPEKSEEEQFEHMEKLIREYSCEPSEKPEWCVWKSDGNGGASVLVWVRPSVEGEWVARKIAKYLKARHLDAGVEMTEWNPDQHGTPIYAQGTEQEP